MPESLMACAAEPDAQQRLACFDREIKRFSAPAGSSVPAAAALAPPPTTAASTQEPAPATSRGEVSRTPAVVASAPRQIRARVEHVDLDGDNFVILKLDNHQTWRQEREAAAELHIKAGDDVTIDRELGAYYLSDRLGTAVRVRRHEQ